MIFTRALKQASQIHVKQKSNKLNFHKALSGKAFKNAKVSKRWCNKFITLTMHFLNLKNTDAFSALHIF